MPTQWAENEYAADAVVGWTTGTFKTALGPHATYQAAAAGAAGVAIANAMKSSYASADRVGNLAQLMHGLDIESFYGKIKFKADGRIEKAMVTQQLQDGRAQIVAPVIARTASLLYPITAHWPAIIKVGGMIQST